jgi:hypothetical protein
LGAGKASRFEFFDDAVGVNDQSLHTRSMYHAASLPAQTPASVVTVKLGSSPDFRSCFIDTTRSCVVLGVSADHKAAPAPLHRMTAVPKRSYTMKMISAVLIALALLSMAAPLYAFDAKSFYEQQDRQSN